MRQVLFYISLDHPFSILPNGLPNIPLLTVGVGYLLMLIWVVFFLWQKYFETPLAAKTDKQHPKAENGKQDSSDNSLMAFTIQLLILGAVAWLISPVRVFPVFGYGMMLLVAFVTGATWAGKRGEQVGFSRELIWDVAMCILASGVLGARIFYLVQKRDQVFANLQGPGDFLIRCVNLKDGGLVFYGGLILATIAYFAFCAYRKVRPIAFADVVVPSIFLGLGFGRIGCLLNGCCYGDRCELPWAITFPADSVPFTALVQLGYLAPDAAVSFPLHPTQIYSSIGGFLLAFITAQVFRYRQKVGEVLAVGAILYPINRFLIEFVRGDEFTVLNTGLTPSQNVSLLVFAVALAYLVWLEKWGVTAPTLK
ncbi:MAG: prolipoprotein diacylglyceryl transferase [Planctomycetaceae bacterium]|nr:prolipoprotein diacylglyceryl transferase [Planctomycetaceae bacterium]